MAKKKSGKKIVIFSLIGVVLIALTLAAIFKKKEPIVTIQTEKVVRTNLTELVMANGKIQPVTQVHISAEVSGEIIELPVKEGQHVNKGDLLLKIKPDFYLAAVNQAKANYESSVAGKAQSMAGLEKATADFKRNEELFNHKLLSESDYIGFKAAFDVAKAQLDGAVHMVDVAKAAVDSAQDSLDKTTIVAPLSGTISKLNSQLNERVLGTVQNAGTDIMIIADLNVMEARVDIGEMDVVLIKPGQNVRLEVDSFKDRKFSGVVTDVANSSEGLDSAMAASSSSTSQEATKFQVRIRIKEKETFRPGMSVTGEIETRSSSNTLAVPFASVTGRPPKPKSSKTNSVVASVTGTNTSKADTNVSSVAQSDNISTNATADKKTVDAKKTLDVVFVVDGDHVKMVPVKTGISDETRWEIVDGLKEGDEIVSGGFRAISRDLDDGKKIKKGVADAEEKKQL
jgi:HlyD family secretion protein